MADIGDLVVRMTMDNRQFVAAVQDSRNQANQLARDTLFMERSMLEADEAARRLSATLEDQAARSARLAESRAKQNLALSRTRAASQLAADQLADPSFMQQRMVGAGAAADRDLNVSRLDTATMRGEFNDAGIQAKKLALDIEKLTQNNLALASANERMGMSLQSPTAAQERLSEAVHRSSREMLEAQAAQQTAQQAMGNSTIQANQLSTALSREATAALQAKNATELLAKTTSDERIQSLQLQQVVQRVEQSKIRSAHASELAARAMAHFTQNANLSKRELRELQAQIQAATGATAGMQNALTRHNVAVSNAIFLVEDAASVYGTQGFAGALRAASNNMTMIALSMGGPLVGGITVATVAVAQLAMAFMKAGDNAQEAREKTSKFMEDFRGFQQRSRDFQQFNVMFGELEESDRAQRELEARTREVELLNSQLTHLGENMVNNLDRASDEYREAFEEWQNLNSWMMTAEIERRDLQQKVLELREAEMRAAKQLAEQEQHWIQQANRQEMLELEEKRMERLLKLQGELQRAMDPQGAQRFDAARRLIDRLQEAREVGGAEEQRGAIEAALMEMRGNMEMLDVRGPSAIQRGSKEELDMERQMILQANAPQQDTNKLLEKLIQAVNAAKGVQEHQKRAAEQTLEEFRRGEMVF